MTIKDRAVIYWQIVETQYLASKRLGTRGAQIETQSVTSLRNVFEKKGAEIMADTLSDKIVNNIHGAEFKKEIKVNGEDVILGISKK
jgi:hypothetical protein